MPHRGVGLATLAACLTAALTGHDGAAIALAASSLVGVVAAFLSARLRDAGAKQDDARCSRPARLASRVAASTSMRRAQRTNVLTMPLPSTRLLRRNIAA